MNTPLDRPTFAQTPPVLNRQGRSIVDRAVTGLGFARHPMISRAGNRFTLVDVAGNERPATLMDQQGRIYIDLVIFDASPHPNRMFFEGIYDPSQGTPPDCFSDNGIGPSTQSRNPQSATCATCPNAVWGSKVTPQGKQVPACQTGKKLAVLVVGDPSGMAYEFRVPPGSFNVQPGADPQEGGWTWYVKALKGHNMELFDVVTRVTFVPNTMGQLVFKPLTQIPPEQIVRVNDAWAANVSDELCGLKDKPIDPATLGQQRLLASPTAPAAAQVQGALPPPPVPPFQQAPAPFAGLPPAPQFAPPAQPQPQPQPEKRRRRTKAEMAAEQQNPPVGAPTPPFLQQVPGAMPVNTWAQEAQGTQPPFMSGQAQNPPGGALLAQFAPKPRDPMDAPFVSGAATPFTPNDRPDDTIPPFLRREAPAPAAPPAAQFGLQQPQAPNADLMAKLDQAFKLPGAP